MLDGPSRRRWDIALEHSPGQIRVGDLRTLLARRAREMSVAVRTQARLGGFALLKAMSISPTRYVGRRGA